VSPEIVTIIAPAVVFAIATVLLTYLIIALSVASTIVDVSPFATNGAVLADAQARRPEPLRRADPRSRHDRRRRGAAACLAGVRRRPLPAVKKRSTT
jgi:hypothetical protein